MIKKYLHTRFRVADMDRSIHFYKEVLGMEVVEQKTSPRGSRLVFLQFPGMDAELELCSFPSSGEVSVPEDLVHLAFQVDDIEACIQKLESAGVPVTEGPITSDNGTRFIFTEDPDKYEIELMQYSEGE
ncbi:MAG: VOC family protein [Candidatus Nitrohelix vancouverensis]|uniref:VOC family protein n=1 Tax=Candidatus Nitrohelix vancouverensis TaxID=2705534 RepID=A0A7T0G340_9BACT|nr:MAG: VOC family protein [Candidatus Nitrohelix vancouverensis]